MNRLSFSLCNTPASWTRCIDYILSGVQPTYYVTYPDDIVVMSTDLESHMHRLNIVLGRLAAYNLKLKAPKSHFLQMKVDFLGHRVSHEGVTTQTDKVKAVAN